MRRLCFQSSAVSVLALGILISMSNHAKSQQPQPANAMPDMPGMTKTGSSSECDEMADMKGMSVMGESMAAMAHHMCITPMRPVQPGDEEKTKALIATVKASIEKYKDYKKALADGFVIGNPKVIQPQSHFANNTFVRIADSQFDPTKPSALLYRRTPTERYKLEGVMFTDRLGASLDELNQRVPLSMARWHKHINFCGAPADKVKEYFGDHPKFGMFGSIYTKEACDAEGGKFFPEIFSWMVHVFPYEDDLKDTFSMNDDIAHVH